MKRYFAVVIGLGAMGSATLYQLSKRTSQPILGIDQFTCPHIYGSSHGESRLTREAVGEGAEYVPFVIRSNQIWQEIEEKVNRSLFVKSGMLLANEKQFHHLFHGKDDFFKKTVSIADAFHIPYEILPDDAIAKRFPQFKFSPDTIGYFEPGGGYLKPENCIEAQIELARLAGADVHYNEVLQHFDYHSNGVTVTTSHGQYQSDYLILAVGPWVKSLYPEFSHHFQIFPQLFHWYKLPPALSESFSARHFPAFWSNRNVYGFPIANENAATIKLATESFEQVIPSADANRTFVTSPAAIQQFHENAKNLIPSLPDRPHFSERCLFTVAPEFNFIMDFYPKKSPIFCIAACSAHGFKHSAGVGEAVAELLVNGRSILNLDAFHIP